MPPCRARYRGDGWAGGRPGRIRRFIEPAVLLLLHQGPAHGYGLAEGLQALGLGDYPVDVSAIYRALYHLEALGMVTSRVEAEGSAGPPRRIYALTEAGDAYLRAWIEDLRATERLLRQFLEAYDAHTRSHNEPDGSPTRFSEGDAR